jgi:hypothetical protein
MEAPIREREERGQTLHAERQFDPSSARPELEAAEQEKLHLLARRLIDHRVDPKPQRRWAARRQL